MSSRKQRHLTRRQLLAYAGLSGLGLTLAACQQQVVEKVVKETVEVPKIVEREVEKLITPTPVAYKKGGSLVFGIPGDIKTLDPHVSQLMVWSFIRWQVFDRLLSMDEMGVPQPSLATAYQWADATTLELSLRDDVTFHNGAKFTADDVKHTADRVMKPDLPTEFRARLASLDSVEVIDATHVRMRLKEPDATFPALLSELDIISKSIPEDHLSTAPIGTGAFKLVDWKPNEAIRLERNEAYYLADLPYLDSIVFKPIPDVEGRISSLMTGDVDVCMEVPAKDVARLATAEGVEVVVTESGWLYIMYVNLAKPPLNDKRIRQALLYGFDRKGFVRDFMAGLSKVTNTPIAPQSWAHNPDVEALYGYDPEKAKELLAQAGFPEGKGLVLEYIYPVGLEEFKSVGEYMQANLADIGVTLKVTGLELAAWSNKIAKEKTYELSLDFRRSGQGDPALQFNDHTFFRPDKDNLDGFTEDMIPGYLELIKQGKAETDQAKRKDIYQKLQKLWAEELPGLIVTRSNGIVATRSWVKGYEITPTRYPYLSLAWLDK
ncbi:MAG: ABC transporter substrate-binding protein [Anaerolineae bacterium]